MKKVLIVAALLVPLGASPAAASRWLLMAGIGANAPTGNLSDLADASLSLQGSIAGPIFGPLHWRGEIGFDSFSTSNDVEDVCDAIGADCDLGVTRYGLGIQLNQRLLNLEPYGYLIFGPYDHKVDVLRRVAVGGVTVTESVTDLGVAFGGGVIFHLGLHLGIAGELRWNKINADPESLWYVTPAAHLVFSW